jgi:D-ribose pyranase
MLRHELILDPRLLALLAGAGHGDIIVVADSGLPIPNMVEVVDLSLTCGVPSFLQVLNAVQQTLVLDRAFMARETRVQPLYAELSTRLNGIAVDEMSHEEFKCRLPSARAIVRTGECTPYANLGLVAGVAF